MASVSAEKAHSHAWKYPEHFGDDFRRQAARARAGVSGWSSGWPALVAAWHGEERCGRSAGG